MEREAGLPEDLLSDKIFNELKEYIKDASIGSPIFQAFFDEVILHKLIDKKVRLFNEFQAKPDIQGESKLRILENKIALHEHEIEQKKIKMPDYYVAYDYIGYMIEDFAQTLNEEIYNENKGDSEKTVAVWEQKYHASISALTDSIFPNYIPQV